MRYIKVWCEYDFNGQFGSNNNEEVFIVSDKLSVKDIDKLVLNYLVESSETSEEDLKDLYDWQYIDVEELK